MRYMQRACFAALLGIIFGLSALTATQNLYAQKSKKQKSAAPKEPAVAVIGREPITLKEFERQYIRNNGGLEAALKSTLEERKDFLDLLIKYRLKVLEAIRKGYDKDSDIRKELAEYRQSLATPYLVERELIDPNIRRIYERRKEDVRVAHILIRMITDTLGVPDTLATLKKAQEVLAQAKAGVPFDSLARQNSADRQSAEHGGDLGFFTAGMTLPAFDDVVYGLKPGELNPYPVRTPFGYHIVKMLERRTSRGSIHASHILVRLPLDHPNDSAAAFAKISLILDTLRRGGNFEELARRNSEDPQSGANGGDLGWAERRKYVPQFEDVAFSLKVGETSGIVRTPFGYHIIKLLGEREARSFDEAKQELKDLYQRYGYQEDNEKFRVNLRNKWGASVQEDVIRKMLPLIDSSLTTSSPRWDSLLTPAVRGMVLIGFSGKLMTVDDAIARIHATPELQSRQLNFSGIKDVAEKLADMEAMAMETKDLETRYPDFAQLMHEYEEGVLLFRAEQEAVWNKVAVTDTMLRGYWEQHKEDYKWPDRVSFTEIFVTSDSLAKLMADSVKAGKDFTELATKHTMRSGYREKKGSWGFMNHDANDLSRAAMKMNVGEVSDPIVFQYGRSIIRVDGKDPARNKTFDEAASEVSSKVQELESKRIEKQWIDSLRKQFGVKEYPDLLKEAFKQETSSAGK